MNTKLVRLFVLVLMISFSFLLFNVNAEDYHNRGNSSPPDSSRAGNLGVDNLPVNSHTVISQYSYTPYSYSNPVVVSPSSYGSSIQLGGGYNYSGNITSYSNSLTSGSMVSDPGLSLVNLSGLNSTPVLVNNAPIPNVIPNNYSAPVAVSSSNYGVPTQVGTVYSASNSYNSPIVVSTTNYGVVPPPVVTYNNAGSNSYTPALVPNYNSAISVPNYSTSSFTTEAVPVVGTYYSQSGNDLLSDAQRAQTMYENVVANVYNSPIVKQAESSGLVVQKSGGYGQNPMTGTPVAYAQVDIFSYDPIANAVTSAFNQGNKEVSITGAGVLTGNPIQGSSRSVVLDRNNPTWIGLNNVYSTHRSIEDLTKDISSYNTNVAATANKLTPVTRTASVPFMVNQAHADKLNTSPSVEIPKSNNKQ